MTDRASHLFVALTNDMRTDDLQEIVKAIEMLRGVEKVWIGDPINPGDYVERARLRTELAEAIGKLLR